MLLNFGGPLVASHAAIYPLLPHVGSVSPERLVSPGRIRSRRRTRPGSAVLGPRFLHPSGSFPDGVPSSLFKLQPRSTPTASPPRSPPPPSGSSEVEESATAVATTPSVVEEAMEALDVRLAEEADLPDISALLADVRTNVRDRVLLHMYVDVGERLTSSQNRPTVCFQQRVHLFSVAPARRYCIGLLE